MPGLSFRHNYLPITFLISYWLAQTMPGSQNIKYILTRYFSFRNALPGVIGEDHLTRILR